MKSKKNGRSRISIPISLLFSTMKSNTKKNKIKKNKNISNKSRKVKNRMARMVGGKNTKDIWTGFSKIIIPDKLLKGGRSKKKMRKFLSKPFGKNRISKIINQ
jgi:hypothetical protein